MVEIEMQVRSIDIMDYFLLSFLKQGGKKFEKKLQQ
jgi:hypothetical protein